MNAPCRHWELKADSTFTKNSARHLEVGMEVFTCVGRQDAKTPRH